MAEKESATMEKDPFGKVLFSWEIAQYEKRDRTRLWYLGMGVLGIALIIYSIIVGNFLFALIILLVAFILFVREYSEANNVALQITEDGLLLGPDFYPYKDLSEFYIIYEPPEIKQLYIKTKRIGPNLSIPLTDVNPIELREQLLKYLDEDLGIEHQELSDSIERLFKL